MPVSLSMKQNDFLIISTVLLIEEKACIWMQNQYSAPNVNENENSSVGCTSL